MKLLLFLTLLLGTTPPPKKLMADRAKSTVTYAMKHPMHDWEGVSRAVNAALVYDDATKQVQQVAVAIPVASFDSKNQNRDSHMVEVLDGLKHPNVTFSSQDIKTNADGSLTANGKLTFHNVTKPVSIQATRREQNGQWTLDGSFVVKLTDFNVERPTLLAVPTEDQFKLSFSLVFK
jgi:polyisoprenoid-binding protein YceI